MKPADVTSSTYVNFDKENNQEGPKFKAGHHVRISNYKNIFAKVYLPNWSEEVFVIKKVKNTVPWAYVISDFNRVKIFGTLYDKELQKTTKKRTQDRLIQQLKGKTINYMLNGKATTIFF